MTTFAAALPKIRRLLNDDPITDVLGAAVSDTTGTSVTVTDSSLYRVGTRFEVDDAGASGAEQFRISALPTTGAVMTVARGQYGSTAATHSNGGRILIEPRFPADTVLEAYNMALDNDLYQNGVYEVVEHVVTTSSTTNTYNAPSTSCERILDIYQRPISTDPPSYIPWSAIRDYKNADTTLWSNGKVYSVYVNYGVPGTASYYINCAHRLAIGTVSTQQDRICQYLACHYLLSWQDIRRLSGPTNQGDRTVRPGQATQLGSAYWKEKADELIRSDRAYLKTLTQPQRRFLRRR